MENPPEDPSKNYKNCQFKSTSCGDYSRRHEAGCVILKNLKDNVGTLFDADVVITEYELICLRSETLLNLDDWICVKHKFTLGTDYRPSSHCKYSDHPENVKSKGRKVSWQLYNFVKSLDGNFILGSLICPRCQKKLNEMMEDEPMECDEDEMDADPDFVPTTPFLDDDEKENRRKQLDCLTDVLEIERIRFQVTSNLMDMSPPTLDYLRRMYKNMQHNLIEKFCLLVAPGQEQEMKYILKSQEKSESESDAVITNLKEAFNLCSTRTARRSVLMLIPKAYSKAKVSELFDCSLYEVKRARDALKMYGPCGIEPKKEKVYSRLSIENARHFIDFLFSTGLLQELAYGTTKLKFDSGDKATVSSTILNGIHEHAVKEYQLYCKEINYSPLGRSTLLKMLIKMKPHVRRKLAGVDSFVVDGIEAFEVRNFH